MIDVRVLKDNRGIRGYRISGHANFRTSGEDIICAGVSMISQTVLESLVRVSRIREDQIIYTMEENTGFLDVLIPDKLENDIFHDSQILLQSLVTGIELMIEAYPDYIKMAYEEV